MERKASRPRPSFAHSKDPQIERTFKDIYDRLPAAILTEANVQNIVRAMEGEFRTIVLAMKAEGLI